MLLLSKKIYIDINQNCRQLKKCKILCTFFLKLLSHGGLCMRRVGGLARVFFGPRNSFFKGRRRALAHTTTTYIGKMGIPATTAQSSRGMTQVSRESLMDFSNFVAAAACLPGCRLDSSNGMHHCMQYEPKPFIFLERGFIMCI